MRTHDGRERQFIQTSRAWYFNAVLERDVVDSVTVGIYHPAGGTTGEFRVTWEKLGDRIVPKLVAFDDAWSVLLEFRDLLELMAEVDNQNITPDQFCEMLRGIGVRDKTVQTYINSAI